MSHLPSQAAEMARSQVFDAVESNPAAIRNLLGVPSVNEVQSASESEAEQELRLTAIEETLQQLQSTLASFPDATTTQKGVTWFAGDGSATAGRAVQANDSRLTVATQNKNGLLSKEDKIKLDKLGVSAVTSGVASIPVIMGGNAVDVTVTFATQMPNTNYFPQVTVIAGVVNLGNVVPTVKTKFVDKCVVTLRNNGLAAIAGGGSLEVMAVALA